MAAPASPDVFELRGTGEIGGTEAGEGERQSSAAIDGSNGLHHALPRADGGKDAWLVLAAAFILEGLVWGKYRVHSVCWFICHSSG